MKTLTIEWRHLDKEGAKCVRCSDTGKTLADVVKSRDTRLWEGFPVLLVNAAKDYRFEYNHVMDNLTNEEEREDFHALLLLSLALYQSYHLSFY